MKAMAEAANSMEINRIEMNDTSIGVITSGITYQYAKEALPNASILKLGMINPLPKQLIEFFAAKVDKLYVIEELEPVIEEQIKSWGICAVGKEIFPAQGELSANIIAEKILGETPGVKSPQRFPHDRRLCALDVLIAEFFMLLRNWGFMQQEILAAIL